MSETQQTRPAFVAASTLLQRLDDRAPSGHFTLEWLMSTVREQSYGAIILLLGIVASAPGISLPAGFLLLVPAFQMIAGLPVPIFPRWIATRPLPTDKLSAVLKRAIPVLKVLEAAVRPRWPLPPRATRRVVGLMILLLAMRLLTNPLPMSNVLPAALISFISLAYLEADGMMLTIGLLVGLITLVVDAKILFDVTKGIVDRIGFSGELYDCHAICSVGVLATAKIDSSSGKLSGNRGQAALCRRHKARHAIPPAIGELEGPNVGGVDACLHDHCHAR